MKKSLANEQILLIIINVLYLLAVICASESFGTSSSWAKLQISSQIIGSVPIGSFRVKIYEHLENQKETTSPNRKRYFYAPIALQDQNSVTNAFNEITNQSEIKFRIELWNEQVENEVINYLGKIVGEKIEPHQVQVIPFENVILTSSENSLFYFLPTTWSPFNLQKSLWFTVTCLGQKDCKKLTKQMCTSGPQQLQSLQLRFSLSSQPSKTKEAEIAVSGPMTKRLLRRFKNTKEIYLREEDEHKLLTELTTITTAVDTFSDLFVVSTESKLKIYNIIKSLIVPYPGEIFQYNELPSIWASVFWNDENYRPDKTCDILNRIYAGQDKEYQKNLSKAYSFSEKMDFEEISLFSPKSKFNEKFSSMFSKEYLENLYSESKDYVEWNSDKFVPKPLVLSKINVTYIHEHYYQLQQRERRYVNISYLPSALSTPINVLEHDEHFIKEEWENLQSAVDNFAKELKETKTTVTRLEKDLIDRISESSGNQTKNLQEIKSTISKLDHYFNETQFAIDESKKIWTETSEDIEYLKTRVIYKPLQGEVKKAAEMKMFDFIDAKNPSLKRIADLIKEGVDINCKNEEGMTPLLFLMKAADSKENVISILRFFIQHGADVKAKDTAARTALHYLCGYYKNDNLTNIISFLILHGVDVNEKDVYEWTALQYLCVNYKNENLIDIIRLFIQNGVDINAKNNDGWTALHYLCRNYKNDNLIGIIRLLIQHKVDVSVKNNDGFHPRDYLKVFYKKDNADEILQLLSRKV